MSVDIGHTLRESELRKGKLHLRQIINTDTTNPVLRVVLRQASLFLEQVIERRRLNQAECSRVPAKSTPTFTHHPFSSLKFIYGRFYPLYCALASYSAKEMFTLDSSLGLPPLSLFEKLVDSKDWCHLTPLEKLQTYSEIDLDSLEYGLQRKAYPAQAVRDMKIAILPYLLASRLCASGAENVLHIIPLLTPLVHLFRMQAVHVQEDNVQWEDMCNWYREHIYDIYRTLEMNPHGLYGVEGYIESGIIFCFGRMRLFSKELKSKELNKFIERKIEEWEILSSIVADINEIA